MERRFFLFAASGVLAEKSRPGGEGAILHDTLAAFAPPNH